MRSWPQAGCSIASATTASSISIGTRFFRIGFFRLISCSASSPPLSYSSDPDHWRRPWQAARSIAGTLAETYLAARGLAFDDDPKGRVLRFAGSWPFGRGHCASLAWAPAFVARRCASRTALSSAASGSRLVIVVCPVASGRRDDPDLAPRAAPPLRQGLGRPHASASRSTCGRGAGSRITTSFGKRSGSRRHRSIRCCRGASARPICGLSAPPGN